jgi:isoleucyl-tRNA synthetase
VRTSQRLHGTRQVLQYWEEIDAFGTSLKLSEGRKPYTFLDGPPFATGTPHYGTCNLKA